MEGREERGGGGGGGAKVHVIEIINGAEKDYSHRIEYSYRGWCIGG